MDHKKNIPIILLLLIHTYQVKAEVPIDTFDLYWDTTTSTTLKQAGQSIGAQGTNMSHFEYLHRIEIISNQWYAGLGIQREEFSFTGNNRISIDNLHNYTGELSIEYYESNLTAAIIQLKPGLYFQNNIKASALDIPILAVTGIPLGKKLSGVIGVNAARFYHKTVPVLGFSWRVTENLKIDAVYPEPTLTFSPSKATEIKIGALLQNGGFLTDKGTPVEYFSLQAGIQLKQRITNSCKVVLAIGSEIERRFDYFKAQGRNTSEGGIALQLGAEASF